MTGQIIAECQHRIRIGSLQIHPRNRMETNQVDPAVQSPHQLHQFFGICQIIVHTAENDVFERQAPLFAEVIPPEHVDNFTNGKSLFGRHQFTTLCRERRVHAYRQVAIALFQEAFHSTSQAYRRNRDSFRAPGITIVCGQHLQRPQHSIQIIHRLTHPHKHHIGQCVPLRDRINLIQDLRSGQIARKALFTRHAELAVHFASHL